MKNPLYLSMNSLRKAGRIGGILLPVLSLFAAHPVQAAGWQANDDDALLFDVRSGKYRLGDGVRGYQTSNGVCVDLADMIIALDLQIRLDKKSRRATGWMLEERRTLTIDREKNTVQIMNREKPLENGDIFDTPEGWCVSATALSAWSGISVKPDLGNALLIIESETKLPYQQVLERQERAAKIRPQVSFDLASLPQSSQPYKLFRTPSVDVNISAGGTHDRRSGQKFDLRYDLLASGELGKASFDARLSSDNRGVPDSLRLRAYRTDPKGELFGPLRATHAAIGDVSTYSSPLVTQSTVGRGAFITNRPVDRPENFDRTSFRGELPLGWDAELYRNNQLIAFAESRSDGRYEFLDVPLQYGQNRFEVVLYGPQGQIRRETRSVPVGLNSIPPKQFWYWAGVHQAGRDLVQLGNGFVSRQSGWRGGVGVERGLDTKTSVSAGLYRLQLDGMTRNFGEVSLRRAIGPTLTEVSAAYDFAGGSALRGQILGELGSTQISGETIWAMGGFESDRILPGVTGRHSIAIDQALKFGGRTIPLHLDSQYVTYADGRAEWDTGARISFNINRISLTTELDWRRQFNAAGPDPPSELLGGTLINGRLGRVRLRGEVRYRIAPQPEFQTAQLTGEWSMGQRTDMRAELGYDARIGRARAALGYTRHFEKFALSGTVEAASDGSVAAGVNLSFSFGPNPRGGGVRFSANKLAQNGQAMAIVYRDLNGDGVRQANEPLQPNVELTAGQGFADGPTDVRGRAMVDELEPFRPVLIGIDASSLSDPYLQPALPGVVVTPRPGIAAVVELPLVSAGEVEGTLVRDGGGTLSGVELELFDAKGRVIKTTRTEYDGFFLFEGVPYGRYGVRMAVSSAQAVRLNASLDVSALVSDAETVARLGYVVARSPLIIAGGVQPVPTAVSTKPAPSGKRGR